MRAPTCLYQLHALRASGSPDALDVDAPRGDGFDRLTAWLDHVAWLGCDAVLLTPVFESSTHGYDTVDPFRVDPRLGDDAAFDRFVERAHGLGLRLVLDGVLNHVGRSFDRFVAGDRDWFRPEGDDFHCFEGHQGLVTLDHRNPDVLAWALDVCRHWLDRGADGWRFDAAYAIPRTFLHNVVCGVRGTHPDAYLFGEVIHGDYAGIVADTGLDSVTQYELHKAIWSSLNDANLFELAWSLERHAEPTRAFRPVTFVGNHDVTRIASRLTDPAHLEVALTVLFTLPGTPCVYYADELAWRGVKEERAGGDDAIRPPLPPNGFSTDAEQHRVLELHHALLRLRRDRPWLADGAVEVVGTTNRTLSYSVIGAGGGAVDVTIDLARALPASPEGTLLAARGVTVTERR